LILTASDEASRRFRESAVETQPHPEYAAVGYPRWKPLIENPSSREETASQTPVVLYAPTHRRWGNGVFDFTKIPGFEEFSTWAAAGGANLLYRGHFAQSDRPELPPPWRDAEVLESDVSEQLPTVDVLITDYSSVFYDYGINRDRMVFLAPDLADYESTDSGLCVEYLGEVPGPVTEDWTGVLAVLRDKPGLDEGKLESFRRVHASLADSGVGRRAVSEIRGLIAQSARTGRLRKRLTGSHVG
jgi:CDP-glycerol glycerophosphotransferase (TagB/SpsB family)